MARRWWYPSRDDVSRVDGGRIIGLARQREGGVQQPGITKPPGHDRGVVDVEKAAALFRSMTKNHPFADGNKRVAVVLTESFLNENGYTLTANNPEVRDFTMKLAASEPQMPLADVARWLRAHARRSEG
jgi:death-on-curing protein